MTINVCRIMWSDVKQSAQFHVNKNNTYHAHHAKRGQWTSLEKQ